MNSKILKRIRNVYNDEYALVEWTSDVSDKHEFSIHAIGVQDSLICGKYFNSYEQAENYMYNMLNETAIDLLTFYRKEGEKHVFIVFNKGGNLAIRSDYSRLGFQDEILFVCDTIDKSKQYNEFETGKKLMQLINRPLRIKVKECRTLYDCDRQEYQLSIVKDKLINDLIYQEDLLSSILIVNDGQVETENKTELNELIYKLDNDYYNLVNEDARPLYINKLQELVDSIKELDSLDKHNRLPLDIK